MKRTVLRILVLLLVVGAIGTVAWLRVTGGVSRERMPEFIRRFLGAPAAAAGLELHGNVEVREVRLGFRVTGRITGLFVDEGDAVQPGQLVAQIEPDYFEDAVRQAEAELEARQAELLRLKNGSRPEEIDQARANAQVARVACLNARKEFQRRKNLVSTGAVSREDVDNAQARLDQAEARLKAAEATRKLVEIGPRSEDISRTQALVAQAQAHLDEAKRRLRDSKLVAPLAGIVQIRVHEPGDYVNIGEPIYVISIVNPVWVRAYVNEMDLERIRPGMRAVVRTDTGRSYTGRIGFISPVAEFTPKTVETRDIRTNLVYRIRVIVPDPADELRQGMPVTVTPTLPAKIQNAQ